MRHGRGDRRLQPLMAKLPAQRQHRHHGASAVLLAVPRPQPIPQLIVAGRPTTGLTPLRQWLRSGQRARFVAQHIEVMLEIEHMLATAVATFVAGNLTTAMPDLDM